MRMLALVLVLLASAATTARADLAADCNQTNDLERQIKACTFFLEDGRASADNLAIAHTNRANAYSMRRRFDLAFPDYKEAIKLTPDDPLVYYNRANAYFDAGNNAAAIADYTTAIAKNPDFALAYYNRGLAHERLGEKKKAADDYARVLVLEPTAAFAKERLRVLRINAGGR